MYACILSSEAISVAGWQKCMSFSVNMKHPRISSPRSLDHYLRIWDLANTKTTDNNVYVRLHTEAATYFKAQC